MSQLFVDNSQVATFDNLLERGDILSPDSEVFISLMDTAPGPSKVYNAGINFSCPPGTNAPDVGAVFAGCTPPESSSIERIEKSVASKELKKKRKSWGEELPIPTTNLPPRKRAKTDQEKEQRRIERILRNRAAAQSSRERKQKEVETLEEERRNLAECNAALRVQVAAVEKSNKTLSQQLGAMEHKLKRYEEYVKAVAGHVAANHVATRAHNHSRSSLRSTPEPSLIEDENMFCLLDPMPSAPFATIDPRVLSIPMWPALGENLIGGSLR